MFFKDLDLKEEEMSLGYVEKEHLSTFPVVRKITIPLYYHNNAYYLRTRDVALLLDIKQPFAFSAFCKEKADVLTGFRTEDIRCETDDSRTTFIEVHELQKILRDKAGIKQKYNVNIAREMITAISQLIA